MTLHLLSRLLRGVALCDASTTTMKTTTTTPLLPLPLPIYEHSWADVVGMVGRDGGSETGAREHFTSLISAARAAGFLPPEAADIDLVKVALSFDVNDFAITDDLLASRASGVFPAAALVNHSDSPNCVTLFCTLDGAMDALLLDRQPSPSKAKVLFGPARFASHSPRILLMRTARAVAAGEELCHCYADLALPSDDRSAYLTATYGFTPPRTPLDDATDAVILATKQGTGALFSLPPTLRVGIVSALGGESGSESVPPPTPQILASLPPATAKTLLRALALAEAGGALGGAGAERDGGEAASRLGVTLDAWTSNVLLLDAANAAAAHATTLSRDEAARVALDEAALGAAIETFSQLLNPLHVAIFGVAGAAISRHLLLADRPAAAAACEHACAFYRAAYGTRCAAHPMLSLQLLTLGDLYRELADAAGGPETTVPRWRLTEARAATLRTRYVESQVNHDGSVSAAVKVMRALRGVVVGGLDADGATAAAAWRRDADAAYTEAYAALCITHGPRHTLSEHACIALEQVRGGAF